MRRLGELTIYEGLEEVPSDLGPCAVSIGVFDGVHRGHQALIGTVVATARARGATPAIITFDRHPLEVVRPGSEPPLITTLPQRARVIAGLGVRALVIMRFDDAFRHLEPDEFVRAVLVDALHCVHVVVGANFRFGHGQAGTVELLRELGARHGFEVTIFALELGEEDQVVSSSMIRRHIADGMVEQVAEELDRPFRLEGYVEHGAGRGKDLGVPTANLRVPSRMLIPKLGVYAGWMIWKAQRYPAVMNVGVNPTFGDRATPIVEVHVLRFDENLYDEIVEIEFTHHLRDELKFDSIDALVRQMHADIARARELLGVS